ncbi:MAG TPA: response regulator [Planctomycetota bacterium]|jgi:DNA-binding NtrC family response regulator|nr:response regulator [Planctomycetota bacterium]
MGDLLLVENDARILELMTLFLAKAGHSVRGAASFELARTAIRERTPDLMLSDLEMGAESGREALPDLAREGLLPPTLVVSGYVDRDSAAELARLPEVVGTLAKPFDRARLLAKVEACLAARSPENLG